jgi:hypothetical protein
MEIECVDQARGKYIRIRTSIACWDGGEIWIFCGRVGLVRARVVFSKNDLPAGELTSE